MQCTIIRFACSLICMTHISLWLRIFLPYTLSPIVYNAVLWLRPIHAHSNWRLRMQNWLFFVCSPFFFFFFSLHVKCVVSFRSYSNNLCDVFNICTFFHVKVFDTLHSIWIHDLCANAFHYLNTILVLFTFHFFGSSDDHEIVAFDTIFGVLTFWIVFILLTFSYVQVRTTSVRNALLPIVLRQHWTHENRKMTMQLTKNGKNNFFLAKSNAQ